VKHGAERGIYFITEWLSNRLSVALGPSLYGLPYRFAKLNYRHTHEQNRLFGNVEAPRQGQFIYEARRPVQSVSKRFVGRISARTLHRLYFSRDNTSNFPGMAPAMATNARTSFSK
jgi:hypothetical protein